MRQLQVVQFIHSSPVAGVDMVDLNVAPYALREGQLLSTDPAPEIVTLEKRLHIGASQPC